MLSLIFYLFHEAIPATGNVLVIPLNLGTWGQRA